MLFFRVANQICQSPRTIAEILQGPTSWSPQIKVQLAEIWIFHMGLLTNCRSKNYPPTSAEMKHAMLTIVIGSSASTWQSSHAAAASELETSRAECKLWKAFRSSQYPAIQYFHDISMYFQHMFLLAWKSMVQKCFANFNSERHDEVTVP